MRFLYDLLSSLAVWLVLVPWELARILRGTGSLRILRERLALLPFQSHGAILVHAVSLGELAAAAPFIRALAPREVVLTVGTRDARTRAEALLRERANLRDVRYLPWDRRRTIERWLRRSGIAAIAVVETEIWPGLYLAAESTLTPLVIVSGRVYPKDAPRYRLARRLFARVLRCASWIGAQSEKDAARFAAIGAAPETVQVVGNLKWDVEESSRKERRLSVLAANTHAGEEALVVEALREADHAAELIIGPRHVGRAAEVRAIAPDAFVVDRVGALAQLYASASVAILGGTFIDAGGHSPIEAAAAGCPVVCGPRTEHVEELISPLREAGALIQLNDGRELPAVLSSLLRDPERRASMSANALTVARDQRGAAQRCAAKLIELAEARERLR